jgi:hypothetical protein
MVNKNIVDKKIESGKRSITSMRLKAIVIPLMAIGIQAVATMPLLRAQINPQNEEKIWKPSIDETTPYKYVNGVKMYDLGVMPRIDQSTKRASPCDDKKDAAATYEDGMYSCPKLPTMDAGDGSGNYFSTISDVQNMTPAFAGYVQNMTPSFAGYMSLSSTKFTTLEATWMVQPALGSTRGKENMDIRNETAYSAQWGGIGSGTDTLIQAGTQSNLVKGTAQYITWFETLPQSAIAIAGFPISANDTMVETISAVQGEANTFTISLMDVTSNQGFNLTVPYITGATLADWVVERPQMCSNNVCGIANYPDTGSATFYGKDYVSISSAVNAQANYADNGSGLKPVSQLPGLNQLVMTTNSSKSATVLAMPSALSSDGTSFTIFPGNSK